ncbi:MAG TPA: hypothetical protein VJB16_02295, partial [archaeon]|nr:hypothetical protein [archaeon]
HGAAVDGAQPDSQTPATPPVPALESLVASPDQAFRLENGVELRSAKDLADQIPKMDDAMFQKYVTENENRFADWVGTALHDGSLAARLRQARTRDQFLQAMNG